MDFVIIIFSILLIIFVVRRMRRGWDKDTQRGDKEMN